MSSSNVWTRSKARMKLFPELLAQCSGEVHIHPVFLHQYCFVCVCCVVCVCVREREREMYYIMNSSFCCCLYIGLFFLLLYYQAAAYGTCVASTTTGKQELAKNMCVKEFEALKSCFQSAVSVFCDYAVHRRVFPNKDPIYTNLH